MYREFDSNCCCHRLFNNMYFSSTSVICRVSHGTRFNVCNTRWYTNNNTRTKITLTLFLSTTHKITDHLLSYFKIRNNTINKWSNGSDVCRGSSKHSFCFMPHSNNLTSFLINCVNRRFVYNYPLLRHIYECICST